MHVLYITYTGLTEPLGQRQVIPYLVGLAAKGWTYSVISFEKPATASADAMRRSRQQLDEYGILWHRLRYHRRPSLPATAYDAIRGMTTGLRTAARIDLIHARSTVPAVVAAGVGLLRKVPWIFDVRGLVAEEYADADHWRRNGPLFRLTAWTEKTLLRRADGIVFLTNRIRDELHDRDSLLLRNRPTAIIPCSVDTRVFRPQETARNRVRTELALGEGPVLTYAGSLGSWYRFNEMLDFFEVARKQLPGLRFLVLTMNPEIALASTTARGLGDSVKVLRLEPPAVPDYLAAADAGICFVGESFSKTASSPTKYAEYLATGLSLVTDRWTGDATRWEGERACILVEAFSQGAYHEAAARLRVLLAEPERAREAARSFAVREFGLGTALDRYDALYRDVLSRAPTQGGKARHGC